MKDNQSLSRGAKQISERKSNKDGRNLILINCVKQAKKKKNFN